MKNKLTDLNDHLFAAIERLGDEDLSGEDLENEIERAKSVVNVSGAIVENGRLMLRATELAVEHRGAVPSMPLLGIESQNDAKA